MVGAGSNRVPKVPTGIRGLDVITEGGLPRGRTVLIAGGPGCGKSLFGLQFLANGATQFDEPGVLISFEERIEAIKENAASIGIDLDASIDAGSLVVDDIVLDPSAQRIAGSFDMEGLFVRIELAVKQTGAKRIVLDTLEVLFNAFPDETVVRAELQRLCQWLKDRELTTVLTAERDGDQLTRHGLEEYVTDCVIVLDHRVTSQLATRRLRVVKYRGSRHGTDEYPFVIGDDGIAIAPISAGRLDHAASEQRIASGIEGLDTLLGGAGYFVGSSILVTGEPGTGKTTVAASFAAASTSEGHRTLYFAFEEGTPQLVRNMRSLGIDLQPALDSQMLRVVASRATTHGLESHIARLYREVDVFSPEVVILDPVSSFGAIGSGEEVRTLATRMLDILRGHGVTTLMTLLQVPNKEASELGLSSLMDTWLMLRNLEQSGERTRTFYIQKSRGMDHSNQVREFVLTGDGIQLVDVMLGPDGVLTGSARRRRVERDEADRVARAARVVRERSAQAERGRALEATIASMRAQFAADTEALEGRLSDEDRRAEEQRASRLEEARSRENPVE